MSTLSNDISDENPLVEIFQQIDGNITNINTFFRETIGFKGDLMANLTNLASVMNKIREAKYNEAKGVWATYLYSNDKDDDERFPLRNFVEEIDSFITSVWNICISDKIPDSLDSHIVFFDSIRQEISRISTVVKTINTGMIEAMTRDIPEIKESNESFNKNFLYRYIAPQYLSKSPAKDDAMSIEMTRRSLGNVTDDNVTENVTVLTVAKTDDSYNDFYNECGNILLQANANVNGKLPANRFITVFLSDDDKYSNIPVIDISTKKENSDDDKVTSIVFELILGPIPSMDNIFITDVVKIQFAGFESMTGFQDISSAVSNTVNDVNMENTIYGVHPNLVHHLLKYGRFRENIAKYKLIKEGAVIIANLESDFIVSLLMRASKDATIINEIYKLTTDRIMDE